MSKFLTILVIFSVLTINVHQCSKILVVYPFAAHSHFTLGFALVKGLLDRGHEVTLISSYPQKNPIKNLRDVSVGDTVIPSLEEMKKALLTTNSDGIFQHIYNYYTMIHGVSNLTLEHDSVKKLLSGNEHFDLVISEHFGGEVYFGFAAYFKAPLVIVSPFSSNFGNDLVANPAPSSYVPSVFGDFHAKMNFWERLQNFYITQLHSVMFHTMNVHLQRKLFNKHFPNLDFDQVLYNVSLYLTNSHLSVHDPTPAQKNLIDIGGFHVAPPKPLPEDLKKFLDDAKEGVILFSMGSNLKSKDLKPDVRAGILKAFSKLKQKVLWKFETDLPGQPDNVKIMKWLPQNDILAHPNVKAFISHGGLLSTLETIYHGVPVIGIPVFGDQKGNIAGAVNKGYAIAIPLPELSEEKLTNALNEILQNPKYAENAKARSNIMHDQPLKPLESAMFWIEYVIRHRGAPHLRSAGLDLAWYQREMLDIGAFITTAAILVISTLWCILKTISNLLRKNQTCKKELKKNKKTN